MKKKKFDTLLLSKNVQYYNRWLPKSVDKYRDILKIKDKNLKNEVGYSLQYLEFMLFELESLNLQSVVKNMKIKTFVISSMSIVEALLTDYLKKNDKYAKESWAILESYESNPKKSDNIIQDFGDFRTKTVVNIMKEVEEKDKQMTLDAMISKISNNKNLRIKGVDTRVLKKLKVLRNKVHLTATQSNLDTSYKVFDENVLKDTKNMLFDLLTDDIFCSEEKDKAEQVYDFLLK